MYLVTKQVFPLLTFPKRTTFKYVFSCIFRMKKKKQTTMFQDQSYKKRQIRSSRQLVAFRISAMFVVRNCHVRYIMYNVACGCGLPSDEHDWRDFRNILLHTFRLNCRTPHLTSKITTSSRTFSFTTGSYELQGKALVWAKRGQGNQE